MTSKYDILHTLLLRRSFDAEHGVPVREFTDNDAIDELLQHDRIDMVPNPNRIYLTSMGKLIAVGDYLIRQKQQSL